MMSKGKIRQDISRFLEVFPGERCLNKWYIQIHLEMPSEAAKTILGSFQSFIIDEPQCSVKHQLAFFYLQCFGCLQVPTGRPTGGGLRWKISVPQVAAAGCACGLLPRIFVNLERDYR